MTCLAKSPNKHNRLWFSAGPISEDFGKFLEEGGLNALDKKAQVKTLVSEYGMDKNDA